MARRSSSFPTELELEILKILWKDYPLTVRAIRDRLATLGRDNAHTSVITMLNIMVDKQYLAKKKHGKTFHYWPIVTQEAISRGMLGDLVSRVFDGSAGKLVLSLIDHREVDDEELRELRELRQIINRKMREAKE